MEKDSGRPDRAAMIDIAARALIDADSTISGYHETHLAIKRPSAVAMFDALDAAGWTWVSVKPSEHEIDRIENCYSDCVDLEDDPRAAAIKLRLAMLGAAHD